MTMPPSGTSTAKYTIVADQTGQQLFVNPHSGALTFGPVREPVANNTFVLAFIVTDTIVFTMQAMTGYISSNGFGSFLTANAASIDAAELFLPTWQPTPTGANVVLATQDGATADYVLGPILFCIPVPAATQVTYTFTLVD
jgi:hypothetical protein